MPLSYQLMVQRTRRWMVGLAARHHLWRRAQDTVMVTSLVRLWTRTFPSLMRWVAAGAGQPARTPHPASVSGRGGPSRLRVRSSES
jgi:hypothetical protein